MGQLSDIAEQYRQAVGKMPLDSLVGAEDYIKDAAAAEAILASTKGLIGRRLQEETPVDGGVADSITQQQRPHSQVAGVLDSLGKSFRRQHQTDYERFESPRTQEGKADYERNKDGA